MGVGLFRLVILFLVLSFSLACVSAAFYINEVMYNPEGSDNNREFVEIYSDDDVNLSDYVIGDLDSNDSLSLINECDSDYSLIVEGEFNYSGMDACVYSAGASIGNGLNKEDTLFLYYNDSLVLDVSYTDDCQEGHSLEYFEGGFFCSFYIGGTPGDENSCGKVDFSDIRINEFFPDPRGDDDVPMPKGEFIELYNLGEEVDLAGMYLEDSAGHKIYVSDVTTVDGTLIESEGFLAVYTNGFSGFLNNAGFEEIRLFDPYRNLIDKVSYGDSEESLSWGLVKGVWRNSVPSPDEENPDEEVEMDSFFQIAGLEDLGSDNESEFGDVIKVRFNVYKGNTSKKSIKLYIDNDEHRVSKLTKAMLHERYTNYSLTLPMFIDPNCNKKYADGDYFVNIGWTSSSVVEDRFRFRINGINERNCDKMYVERSPRKGTLNHNLLEAPGVVEQEKDFTVMVELTNNDGEDHLVDLYSYVYRGRTTYSGDKELNKKSVLVKAGETREVGLSNSVDADPGEYKLKIKVKRDDQKTEKEITQPITVLGGSFEEKVDVKAGRVDGGEGETSFTAYEVVDEVIYESTSEKAGNLVVPFLIGLLVIYSCVLTWKK